MDKKKYLQQYQFAKWKIEQSKDRLKDLELFSCDTEEYKKEHEERIKENEYICLCILDSIKILEKREQECLIYRYILGWKWNDIRQKMKYIE